MNTKIFFVLLAVLLTNISLSGQGTFSGGLQLNGNFFQRDTTIGASGTPQYDNLLYGGEGWLNLNYSISGFDFGLRFDMYQNSNLPNPLDAYTGQGIGYWSIKKKVQKLGITVGHFYDQLGSGIVFRAYEERPLAIDNAILGMHLTYDLTEDWQIKAFTGRQKNPFGANGFIIGNYKPIIKGLGFEGYVPIKDNVTLVPGIGVVNRTLDQESMDLIVADINTYAPVDSFIPKYNVFVFSAYNTLTAGDFSWYVEGTYKTNEAILGRDGILIDRNGTVFYSSLSYSRKGLGITLQGKRTENFSFRTSPAEILNNGVINYLPTMTRQNTKRLASRYNAAFQELGELGFQADVLFRISKKISGLVNFSNITDLDGELLYREIFTEAKFSRFGPWALNAGVQYQQYNQEVFEGKPGVPLVESIVPHAEFTYKFSDKKKSLRTEWQYQYTKQDFGQWLYGLIEFNIAPNWSFSASDMINIVPKKSNVKEHYYSFSTSYTQKANKFTLSYVKQVEGIICTGGVCRFEPAFNGAKVTVNSRF